MRTVNQKIKFAELLSEKVRSGKSIFLSFEEAEQEVLTVARFTEEDLALAQQVFNKLNDIDSYKVRASEFFGVPIDQVTEEQRKFIKRKTFAEVYGGNPLFDAAYQEQFHQRASDRLKSLRELLKKYKDR